MLAVFLFLGQMSSYAQISNATQTLKEEKPDLNKESLFKAIFVGGLNLSQVDGDYEFGYRKVGAHVGVGTLIKFHKNFSTSLELLYSMKGARPRYSKFSNGSKNPFNITLDYIEVPLSLNVHDKKLVMATVGMTFGALMNYKEITMYGNDTTNSPAPFQQPRKFDLSFHCGFAFLIKESIGIGVRFNYSVLKLRDAVDSSKLKGQYNNTIAIRISYILDPKKLKNAKRR